MPSSPRSSLRSEGAFKHCPRLSPSQNLPWPSSPPGSCPCDLCGPPPPPALSPPAEPLAPLHLSWPLCPRPLPLLGNTCRAPTLSAPASLSRTLLLLHWAPPQLCAFKVSQLLSLRVRRLELSSLQTLPLLMASTTLQSAATVFPLFIEGKLRLREGRGLAEGHTAVKKQDLLPRAWPGIPGGEGPRVTTASLPGTGSDAPHPGSCGGEDRRVGWGRESRLAVLREEATRQDDKRPWAQAGSSGFVCSRPVPQWPPGPPP